MHYQTFRKTMVAPSAVIKDRFVDYAGAQAGAASAVLGVADIDAAAGDAYTAHTLGEVGVEAAGAINAGDPVIPSADGRALADAGTAANRVGRATSTVTAAGQHVLVLIR